MKRSFFIPCLFIIVAAVSSLLAGTGCASIVPPQGGPRDSLPPFLLKANPKDSATNFTGTKITFAFNEYVEVQNAQENLLVSPLPKNNPVVDFKLKEITVKLKDTLQPNTTYTLNFGNAVKDYTEGNIYKNFTYTFSTGDYIDSLELTGKVIIAETGKADSTLIVMLHTNPEDSAVAKTKPDYIARLDSAGDFHFKNLPPKTFYVYALKDEGGTRRYFGEKQLFAFADTAYNTAQQNQPLILYAFAGINASEKKETPVAVTSGLSPGRNKPGVAAVDKRLKFQTNLLSNQQDLLSDFEITFEQPLQSFDSSKMQLFIDSTFQLPGEYLIVKDSNNRKITLQHAWKENMLYQLILDKNFAEDSTGKKLLKTDTLHFTTKKKTEYGQLKLRFRNLDMEKNPVLFFILNQNVYKTFPLTSSEFTSSLFLPGEYELRILFDSNKNGKWDTGQFFDTRKQPELVFPLKRKITVKPNWQNEFDISL